MTDLGLVPGVKIPPKFKVSDFFKYKGVSCPKTHVKSYFGLVYAAGKLSNSQLERAS